MTVRIGSVLLLAGLCPWLAPAPPPASACCPAPPPGGKPVVNADQSVILIWDARTKTQHFIRQASFQSEADDFGFLVPTPAKPELAESGDKAFAFLQKLTEPEKKKWTPPRTGCGIGCVKSAAPGSGPPLRPAVRVLEERMVAGFDAKILESDSADALATWLKDNGFEFSTAVKDWAKPYVGPEGWKITALKVAKGKESKEDRLVGAKALRLSFQTDRPLFPYREPESKQPAEDLGVKQRLLRIYFIADARYRGDLNKDVAGSGKVVWTGRAAWSDKLDAAQRKEALELLQLPETTGPETWWMTEFEDPWPYQTAPADLYFARADDQGSFKRPPIYVTAAPAQPGAGTAYALAAVLLGLPALRLVRRGRKE
jgi:hypothetical protein